MSVLHLSVRLNGTNIVNELVPVTNPTETSLIGFIRDEVAAVNPSAQFELEDVKVAKTHSGTGVGRMLHLPASVLLSQMISEAQKALHVIIRTALPQVHAANVPAEPPRPSPCQIIKSNSKSAKKEWEAKFSLPQVEEFLAGYAEAANKATFLSNFDPKVKPSIKDQLRTFLVSFLAELNLKYVTGSGGEDKTAKIAINKTVDLLMFIHENRQTLSRDQHIRFKKPLLTLIEPVIRSKANCGKREVLTKANLLLQYEKATKIVSLWPRSLKLKPEKLGGDRVGEELFQEIENLADIISTHLKRLQSQDLRNFEALTKSGGRNESGSRFKTHTRIVSNVPKRKQKWVWSEKDKRRYDKMSELKKELEENDPYTIIHLSDEKKGLSAKDMCCKVRSRERLRFDACLGFKDMKIGIFTMERIGSVSNWSAVFKIPVEHNESHPAFIATIAEASKQAPTHLSRRQTADAIRTIANAWGKTQRVAKAILTAVLPDSSLPSFTDPKEEQAYLDDVNKIALGHDSKAELEMIEDMRRLNGGDVVRNFVPFWEACCTIIEGNGTGAHERRHARADTSNTNDVSYAPAIVSIPQLKRKAIELLQKEGKELGKDYDAPSTTWIYLALSPNNEYRKLSQKHFNSLPFVFKLQERNSRDFSHIFGHWNSCLKRNWRYQFSKLYGLFEDLQSAVGDAEVTPCLPPREAIFAVGLDDKTGVPVGSDMPVSSISRQAARAVVQHGVTVSAADHDFSCLKLTPSVAHIMNLSRNAGDSLYSGGPDGNGRVTVSVHDAILNPSSGIKHSTNLFMLLKQLSREYFGLSDSDETKPNPYCVLVETDGGPDHNLTHLRNQLAMFALFLVGNMDKLVNIRGCPGLSFLLTAERPMSLLTLGSSGLSLMMDPNADHFLKHEVLENANSMKAVREAITQYDDQFKLAIEVLERRQRARDEVPSDTAADASTSMDDEDSNNSNGNSPPTSFAGHSVGEVVKKFFPRHGLFEGRIVSINASAENGKYFRVRYEDNDSEDLSHQDLLDLAAYADIPIGDIGFRFIKKFDKSYFTGTVTSIMSSSEKRKCVYCDGDVKLHTLREIKSLANNKVLTKIIDDDGVSDGSVSDAEYEPNGDSEEVETDENELDGVAMGDAVVINADESNVNDNVAEPAAGASATSKPKEKRSNGKYFDELMQFKFPSVTLDEHVATLKARPSAKESFATAMDHPKEILESRYSNLELDGRPVLVTQYPTDEAVEVMIKALKEFDPGFNPNYTNKSALSKMPWIQRFFNCPRHCRITDFSLEFRLCADDDCELCHRIGRGLRSPDEWVNGHNVRHEVLRFIDLPIVNRDDPEHFLGPEETREFIDSNNCSLEDLKRHMPDPNQNNEEKRKLAEDKETDKKHKKDFKASKVRATIECDGCGAPRCIYSSNCAGSANGPSNHDKAELERWMEGGYFCGNAVSVGDKYFVRTAIRCGNFVEPQYYNPKDGTKGGRIVTETICAVCFSNDDIVSSDEIVRERDIGGKNPLPICRDCFVSGVTPPTSAGNRANFRQQKEQAQATKRRQLDLAVARGYKKAKKA